MLWLAGASWLAAQEATAPADSLRIIAHRDSLIFAPGEQFTFDLEPRLSGVEPSTTIDIAASLTPARSRTTRWNTQQRLPVPFEGPAVATLHVPLPREEGVYEIHLAVTRPPGFGERFFPGGGGAPLVERAFQVVVLDRYPKLPAPDAEWRGVVEIDPSNPAWTAKLADWTRIRRIPGMSRRPIGSTRVLPLKLPTGNFVELPATPSHGEAHWQAYQLSIESTGGPHLLEVEYPSDHEQHLGISIVEPEASGQFVTIGRDSGVYVEGLGASERVETQKHRIVFWPHTNSPLVLVSNQHPTATARFGTIRVYKRTASTLATEPWPTTPHPGRLVAAYLANPVRPVHSRKAPTDDWLGIYDGAIQLTEYLNFAGYNAAAVNVMAEGASLVPPHLLQLQTHPDVGPIAANSDMPTADGLELMLRIFDRAGLALIPALEFTAPLPALETLRQRVDPHSGGIELVGPAGLTWLETHTHEQHERPPQSRYNLLDPRVQQAMLDMVEEIVSRYGRHPSFQSVAVQLSSRGYGVLPGLEWGLDDTTVGRFEEETGTRLRAEGPDRFAMRQSLLTGRYAELWRSWRAQHVTRFYERLAQVVAASHAERKLLLTTEGLFYGDVAAERLRPNVTEKPRLETVMLDMGINWNSLLNTPGVVLLPTRNVASMTPLVDRAIDLSINEAFASLEKSSSALLLFHRPHVTQITSVDALNPFGLNRSPRTQSAAHGAAARQPYITAMAVEDPTLVLDGGELPSLGEEAAVRQLRSIVRALPQAAATSVSRSNNVSVRTYNDRGQEVLLVLNECPWHADVTLAVSADSPATAIPLVISRDAASQTATEQFVAGQQLWSLRLAPYDVHAVRFAGASPKIERIDSQISDAGRQELAARVNELKERDLTATPSYTTLKNPGFEPTGGGSQPAGWQFVGNAATAKYQLDAAVKQQGQTSLYLQNSGAGVASIVSDEFPVPPTGQLGMLVFVCGQNVGPATTVRLVFEIEGQPTRYRQYSVLGGERPGAVPITADWGTGFAFGQDDLPLDSRARMRIKFELTGPGEIWIDNVQLYSLLFPLYYYGPGSKERLQLVKRRAEAESELNHGELAECVRTLEGYWPRFINAYTPMVVPAIANQPPAAEPPAPQGEQPPVKETPSVSKRSWFNFWSR